MFIYKFILLFSIVSILFEGFNFLLYLKVKSDKFKPLFKFYYSIAFIAYIINFLIN